LTKIGRIRKSGERIYGGQEWDEELAWFVQISKYAVTVSVSDDVCCGVCLVALT